jgi:hypothetical protein
MQLALSLIFFNDGQITQPYPLHCTIREFVKIPLHVLGRQQRLRDRPRGWPFHIAQCLLNQLDEALRCGPSLASI